ncbi:uncharacterized protein LOC116695341 isoform X2 [Etheostoma spectabile]|uniref:uncharacterized protein LOC116695341 isoform X2 n=1 Tax=Etheostoma spectabile TaxID=54343 RepID=UPI0013AF5557|nr:uncharacterized protein LOC116695341 isoform X2 [Etheostoma spectabile]
MDAIFNLLERHRLESYYLKFVEFGVKDERDFIDGVTDEDLNNIGLSQVEKNRFSSMKDNIRRLRAPAATTSVKKSLESFYLQYTYPKCPEPKYISDMDPAQNTVEDLMLRICHMERVNQSKGVCLYTVDGMPLTDDPFFNTWSLKDRHIENKDVIYAIFTPKENLKAAPHVPMREVTETNGTDKVRCHIMLKGDFEVTVNLESDTISNLKNKLANESGIPGHVLHYKGGHGNGSTLESCGISEESTVHFSLSTFPDDVPDQNDFFIDDVVPSVQQTPKGISFFLSSLYVIKNRGLGLGNNHVIAYIRKLTGCNPLAQSLYQLLSRNEVISRNQKIAVVEGLYVLFRELLPTLGTKRGDRIIDDLDVFEYSTYCWAHLLSEAKKETADHENYAPFSLMSEDGSRFCDPVNVPGIPGVFERAVVLQKIKEKLGVYLTKNKASPSQIEVHDCLAGKTNTMDVSVLANITGDHRDDSSVVTTGTPKEAILVIIDASSSMEEKCYGSVDIQKIHAVKELFDNFATRTMAYDFHHVIGLVKFNSTVETLHTLTESLEKFKEQVRTLNATGATKLYDALQHGILELEKAKKFEDCKLRILCLTDGNDVGSLYKPDVVAANLIKSNIIVDSVLLGKVENNVLCGISNATGGCCFKPETSKDGLKIFEIETVLSLEWRKPKNKADPSSITISFLTANRKYDEFPETVLPSQMSSKVTVTESALKKKMRDDKIGKLMDKEKRILEELRSLHCDPHPYFTILPSESDFTFWKILMDGPPDTAYEKGAFELFCQFGPDYPVKPPLVRFVTRVYHCNINSVGRICHNIFDRNYNAQITMRDILNAVYGLLIVPEPDDPLDSILAEEFMTSRETYEKEAKKHTEETASQSREDMEKKLVDPGKQSAPQHLICPLTKKMFVDPVRTKYGNVYERKAIEEYLKTNKHDPKGDPAEPLTKADLRPANDMRNMVKEERARQLQEK